MTECAEEPLPEKNWSEEHAKIIAAVRSINPTQELYKAYRRYEYQAGLDANLSLLQHQKPSEIVLESFAEFQATIRRVRVFAEGLEAGDRDGLEDVTDWLISLQRIQKGYDPEDSTLESWTAALRERFEQWLRDQE
jgi:hypothetical protein